MAQLEEITMEMFHRADVRAALWVLGSLIVAAVADWVITRGLRQIAKRSRTDFDDRLIAVLHRPLFFSVFLFGVNIAIQILEPKEPFDRYIMAGLQTLVVLIWMVALLRISGLIVRGLEGVAEKRSWLDARMLPLFENVGRIVVIAGAIYALLVAWNLDVTPWLGTAGIAGIALGFAAKDSLANIFGGLSIIVDAPYKVGDYINLESGERGMVTKIGLRSTRILTRDDIEVTVPNSIIANATIINESGGRWIKSRVTVRVGVAYGSDVDEVREVLLASTEGIEDVLREPTPIVRFTELGDSALIFRLMLWIGEPAMRGRVIDEVTTAVYKNLNARGIKIPFPQRELSLEPALAGKIAKQLQG